MLVIYLLEGHVSSLVVKSIFVRVLFVVNLLKTDFFFFRKVTAVQWFINFFIYNYYLLKMIAPSIDLLRKPLLSSSRTKKLFSKV